MPRKKPKRGSGRDELGQFKSGHKVKGGRRKKSEDYSDILHQIYNMPLGELEKWAADPVRNQFELVVHSWVKEAKSGNIKAIQEVLDRLMGKVAQVMEYKETNDDPDLSNFSDEELAEWEKLCEKVYDEND